MASSVKARVEFAATMTALMLVMGLSGCGRPAQDANTATAAATLPPLPGALPLATGPVVPSAPAPSVAVLPGQTPATRARLADPNARYAYLDRAYGQSAAADVAPPDYAFDYGGVRPWAWDAEDRSREIVEPVPGGYRHYYYSPGADAPYLVRDPAYTYAYDGPALVAVFDREGVALPPDPGYDRALYAGRYLARARALYAESLRANRSSVIAADWAAHRAEVAAARSQWAAQQARQAEWRAYHAGHEAEEQAYWQGERARREAAAARFDGWRARSYDGPPPALYEASPRPAAVAFAPPVVATRPARVAVAPPRPVEAVAPPAVAPERPAFAVPHPAPVMAGLPLPAPPRMPHPERTTFVPREQYDPARREPIAAPRIVHAARPVEVRPAPARSAPPRPRQAPPERVVVARGPDAPRPEAARHSEFAQRSESARPHEPRPAPAPQVAAVRLPEPRRAAPAASPPHAPEQRTNDHRPAHGEDHAHDHR